MLAATHIIMAMEPDANEREPHCNLKYMTMELNRQKKDKNGGNKTRRMNPRPALQRQPGDSPAVRGSPAVRQRAQEQADNVDYADDWD